MYPEVVSFWITEQLKFKWFLNFLIGNLRAYGGCLGF